MDITPSPLTILMAGLSPASYDDGLIPGKTASLKRVLKLLRAPSHAADCTSGLDMKVHAMLQEASSPAAAQDNDGDVGGGDDAEDEPVARGKPLDCPMEPVEAGHIKGVLCHSPHRSFVLLTLSTTHGTPPLAGPQHGCDPKFFKRHDKKATVGEPQAGRLMVHLHAIMSDETFQAACPTLYAIAKEYRRAVRELLRP